MDVLFFKEYLEPLKLYLQKFREAEKVSLNAAQPGKSNTHSHDAK
jgi:hypothetical protein